MISTSTYTTSSFFGLLRKIYLLNKFSFFFKYNFTTFQNQRNTLVRDRLRPVLYCRMQIIILSPYLRGFTFNQLIQRLRNVVGLVFMFAQNTAISEGLGVCRALVYRQNVIIRIMISLKSPIDGRAAVKRRLHRLAFGRKISIILDTIPGCT